MVRFSRRFLCLALVGLAGCASDDTPVRHCPQVAILRPLETITDYADATQSPQRLTARGHMDGLSGECAYKDEGVDISFVLTLHADKGPALASQTVRFPFFISILDGQDRVLQKKMMSAAFTFKDAQTSIRQEMPLHVFLPLAKNEDAAALRVLTGFQLTEAQLAAEKK